MKLYITLLTLLLSTVVVQAEELPLFEINLDLPPEQRFVEVAKYFKP